MSVEDIDREIAYNTQCNLDSISLSSIDETSQNLENIKAKLPSEYLEYLDVFDRAQADKLPSHRSLKYRPGYFRGTFSERPRGRKIFNRLKTVT